MSDQHTTGLYHKFNVSRTDGSSEPGCKHHGCDYFVLDLTHDPFAMPALAAYAEGCKEKYPQLAEALADKLTLMKAQAWDAADLLDGWIEKCRKGAIDELDTATERLKDWKRPSKMEYEAMAIASARMPHPLDDALRRMEPYEPPSPGWMEDLPGARSINGSDGVLSVQFVSSSRCLDFTFNANGDLVHVGYGVYVFGIPRTKLEVLAMIKMCKVGVK